MELLKGKGIITPIQKDLLIEFGKMPETVLFYLTGGTALAEFYLGHRRSYDLDLFTGERNLIIPFARALEARLPREGYVLNVIRRFESFVEIEVKRGGESAVLHLAYDTPFRFQAPDPSEFGIMVNDYQDLVVDKVLTFFGRWKHRDAIDLSFILKTEPVESLMEMARKKDTGFDLYWFSVALKEVSEFPDQIDQWPVDLLVEVNAKELKSKFLSLAREIMDTIKPAT